MRQRRSVFGFLWLLLALTVRCAAYAAAPSTPSSATEIEDCRALRAQTSVTRHHFAVGTRTFDYTATAGTLPIRDDDDKPVADIGYVAYTQADVKHNSPRPILFAFNGGPGSSAVWLHMGLLGPKRVLVTDGAAAAPAPFRTVDNEFSLLDRADLVMIDAVGTGLSRAICGRQDSDFWSADADIDSVSRFIAQYVTDNDRWRSPKYLLGESYGTTRAAAIVDYLRARRMLTFNGLVLVSVALDMELVATRRTADDRPYPTYLPSFAAAAWYHHVIPGQSGALEPFLEEVRRYAAGPFAAALMKGNALPADELDAVAEQVHRYTGLSAEYVKSANLRISRIAFAHELLRSRGLIVGVLDARFTGPTQDLLRVTPEYDVLLADIGPAFTGAFQDYLHGDLKFGDGRTYKVYPDTQISEHWNYARGPGGPGGPLQTMINSEVDLAQTIVQDPNLRVLVLNGYYDLGSPFATTEYMISHLRIPAEDLARIQMKYYPAGHMMYVNLPSLRQMKADLDVFVDSTH